MSNKNNLGGGEGGVTPCFVFGSNLAGRHGAGSARHALIHCGARYGVGVGYCGNSYAIPTKGHQLEVLPLGEIAQHVATFVEFARRNPQMNFEIVKVGCGLAGYNNSEIAPLFRGAPDNCQFHSDWLPFLTES
jgi:hypothetical protein